MAVVERYTLFGREIPLPWEKMISPSEELKLDVIMGRESEEVWRYNRLVRAVLTVSSDDVVNFCRTGDELRTALIGEDINYEKIELDAPKKFWVIGRKIKWAKT